MVHEIFTAAPQRKITASPLYVLELSSRIPLLVGCLAIDDSKTQMPTVVECFVLQAVLTDTLGFGGHNAALVLTQYPKPHSQR